MAAWSTSLTISLTHYALIGLPRPRRNRSGKFRQLFAVRAGGAYCRRGDRLVRVSVPTVLIGAWIVFGFVIGGWLVQQKVRKFFFYEGDPRYFQMIMPLETMFWVLFKWWLVLSVLILVTGLVTLWVPGSKRRTRDSRKQEPSDEEKVLRWMEWIDRQDDSLRERFGLPDDPKDRPYDPWSRDSPWRSQLPSIPPERVSIFEVAVGCFVLAGFLGFFLALPVLAVYWEGPLYLEWFAVPWFAVPRFFWSWAIWSAVLFVLFLTVEVVFRWRRRQSAPVRVSG